MAKRDLTGAVNFAYLEDYVAGDQTLVEEVLGLFREQALVWSRLLDPTTPDLGWRDAAHTLKGSARGVGAAALAAACEAAEAIADGADGERAVRLGQVRDALDAALADIAAYQHEQALRSLRS